jgi:hypothetical protein
MATNARSKVGLEKGLTMLHVVVIRLAALRPPADKEATYRDFLTRLGRTVTYLKENAPTLTRLENRLNAEFSPYLRKEEQLLKKGRSSMRLNKQLRALASGASAKRLSALEQPLRRQTQVEQSDARDLGLAACASGLGTPNPIH